MPKLKNSNATIRVIFKHCVKVSKSPDIRAVSFDATAVKVVVQADQSLSGLSAVDTTESAAATAVLTMAAAAANTTSSSRLQLRHVQNCNERRRIFEDNLAAVCMGFVLAFLVCHFPRLLLNMHELITMKVAMKCLNIGLHPFSVWSMVTIRYTIFEKSNFCTKIQVWQNPNIFTSFSLKFFLTIVLVKSKLSTAKKSKTTTFSRQFSREIKVEFLDKKWRFRTVWGTKYTCQSCLCHTKCSFPFFFSVSHFLLVVNSATNILVYCLLSSRFREECAKIIKENYNCFLRRRSAAAEDHNEDHENDDVQPQV